jgi:hypothetical protein
VSQALPRRMIERNSWVTAFRLRQGKIGNGVGSMRTKCPSTSNPTRPTSCVVGFAFLLPRVSPLANGASRQSKGRDSLAERLWSLRFAIVQEGRTRCGGIGKVTRGIRISHLGVSNLYVAGCRCSSTDTATTA